MSQTRTLFLLGGSITLVSGLWLACGGSSGANDALLETEAGAPDTGTGGSDGSVGDGGGNGDGGTPTPEAGGGDGGINPPDAGPGGGTTTLNCGATTCAIPGQSCCVDRLGRGQFSFGCFTGALCPQVDAGGGNNADVASLKCSGQANCAAGTVCCVSQVGGNNSAASDCKAACGNNEAQLCDPNAMPTGCGAGQGACSNNNIGDWSLPPTYATCGGVGN